MSNAATGEQISNCGAGICPHCSENDYSILDQGLDDDYYYYSCQCTNCNNTWTEWHRLDYVETTYTPAQNTTISNSLTGHNFTDHMPLRIVCTPEEKEKLLKWYHNFVLDYILKYTNNVQINYIYEGMTELANIAGDLREARFLNLIFAYSSLNYSSLLELRNEALAKYEHTGS